MGGRPFCVNNQEFSVSKNIFQNQENLQIVHCQQVKKICAHFLPLGQKTGLSAASPRKPPLRFAAGFPLLSLAPHGLIKGRESRTEKSRSDFGVLLYQNGPSPQGL
jgi:hypothetical protein